MRTMTLEKRRHQFGQREKQMGKLKKVKTENKKEMKSKKEKDEEKVTEKKEIKENSPGMNNKSKESLENDIKNDKPEEINVVKNNDNIIQNNTKEPKISKKPQNARKSHSLEEMIAHLKMRRKQDREKVDLFTKEKKSNFEYHYWQNTITADLVLDQVVEERDYILKIIRTLVKEKYFTNS
jgi:hypothetical protein